MTICDRLAALMRQAALSKLSLIGHHTFMASQILSNPPWKNVVLDILQKNLDEGHKESLNFQLATIKAGPNPRPGVRTVVFRGFVGETRDDSPPELHGRNPPAESSLFLVSTDALMAKVGELEQSNGVFEVCWWHAGTNQQIRFNGIAHVYRNNPGDFPESHLKQYIRVQGDGEWSWEKERERVWTAHKPAMRGSFRNPPPGTELDDEKKKKLQVVEIDSKDNGPDAQEAKDRKKRWQLALSRCGQRGRTGTGEHSCAF